MCLDTSADVDLSVYVHSFSYSILYYSLSSHDSVVGASSRNESLGTLGVNPCFDGFGQYIPGTVLCQSLIMMIS